MFPAIFEADFSQRERGHPARQKLVGLRCLQPNGIGQVLGCGKQATQPTKSLKFLRARRLQITSM